ncbi:hypothetical protein K144313037_p20790 (plasmid) [Clostridium tetani]|uniref:hypothetical protein n=1 Tax=Clostridium tetani TaxID=1513 RepID=UPI00295468C4|nr:hypothetical protein [Clostridium tetani]BDR66725.1 hypothetical protein K144312032_09530 [Clostridium tetani]BDR71292.1 hypothetical protein K144313037_p20790 [Clostridium tetani]BDR72216.1 hypothetical protein K144316041_09240 [Clostridium tetani]BEV19093.1 hypothetical protein K154301001_09480 [Clostridium tetani]
MTIPLEMLKFNLQEREYPYFEDNDLSLLLQSNDNNINKASYKGCLLKANADDRLEVAGVKLSSNRQYWLGLAEEYKKAYEESLQGTITGYKTSMKRVDGQ